MMSGLPARTPPRPAQTHIQHPDPAP
jgi:hypothetical protein